MHNILRELRKKRGLTIKELAKRLDYSYSSIRDAEVGRRISPPLLSAYNRYFRRDFPDDLQLTCFHCKREYLSPDGLSMYCPECYKAQKKCGLGIRIVKEPKEKEVKWNQNPITKDTVMIICMFHLEGQTVKQISSHLMRPEKVVGRLLLRAKRDGRYRMYWEMKHADVFYPGAKLSAGCERAYKHKYIKEDIE